MEWLELVWWLVVVLVLVQLVSLAMADGDLLLMWAERFGRQPEMLAGKVVWITGASSGIGEYLAYELARVKCKLILSARRREELERVKKQCMLVSRASEDNVVVLPFDQSDYDSHKAKFEEALKLFGDIDILVNNAGRSQRAMAEETELAVDRAVMDLNYVGVLSLTKQILPHMMKQNQGHIVVTSSIAGKLGAPCSASYTGSKHALQGWFDALRTELGMKPIAVTMVCPGPVFSNITQTAFTGSVHEVHGVAAQPTEKRMSTARCAELMAVAIANRLDEVWISTNPVLLFTYISQYFPNLSKWLARRIGTKFINSLREGRH